MQAQGFAELRVSTLGMLGSWGSGDRVLNGFSVMEETPSKTP